MSFHRLVGLICAVSLVACACGKSTPTGPTGSTGSTPNTYVAELTLASGVTGTLTLRASSSLASREPRDIPVWSRLLAWVEPAVAAQSSTATGLLVTSDGVVVTLSGTFNNGTFNVSGGGYTIVAAVTSTSTGTSISGTATVPGGGTAAVTPPAMLPGTSPAPANPAGTYSGTFHIETTASYVNRRVSDNSLELNCTFSVTVDGNLKVTIPGVPPSGLVQAQLDSTWTETQVPVSCRLGDVLLAAVPPSVLPSTVSPGPGVAYFEGSASSLVFGHADRGPNQNGQGTITRVENYVGAFSGSTVVMRVSRSFQFVNQFTSTTSGPLTHVSGYPTVSALTTLTKQ